MSNSSLVNFTKISPNSNNPRKDSIKKITIHHMGGNLSVESCGNVFANPSRQASSNYGIGSDGRVGLYVEECNRAWTSSSPSNDNQAITIEVANDEIGGQWHISDVALAKLIDLCVDICKRNGIEKLNYTGDATGNLTRHNMFKNTTCPGPYLQSKFPYIAEQVNNRLAPKLAPQATKSIDDVAREVLRNLWGTGADRRNRLASAGYDADAVQTRVNALLGVKPTLDPITPPTKKITVGGKVRVTGTHYATGEVIPAYVKQNTYTVQQLKTNSALLKEIMSWVNLKDLQPL